MLKKMWVLPVVAFVFLWVIFLVWEWSQRLAGSEAISKANVGLTAISAVIGFFGFAVLVWYTFETYHLRRTAQRQLESTSKPVLLFDFSSVNGQSGVPKLRNIGTGPAFKVAVDFPKGNKGCEIVFSRLNVVEANTDWQDWDFLVRFNGVNHPFQLVQKILLLKSLKSEFPPSMVVAISYESLSGKRYNAVHHITTDFMKTSTMFEEIIEE